MRVRGAGGLLVGIVLMPIADTFELRSLSGQDAVDAWRETLWFPDGFSPEPGMMVVTLVRDVLLLGGLVVGIAGLAGARGARIPVGLCGLGIAVGALPWAIWDFDRVMFTNAPPDWVFDYPLWFPSGRWAAVTVLLAALTVAVMAFTDRAPAAPGGPGGPGYGPAPGGVGATSGYGPPGGAPPPGSPWPPPGSPPWAPPSGPRP